MTFDFIDHDSIGEIAPGVTCTMIARPQIAPVLPRSVAIEVDVHATFLIVEITVGNRPQRHDHRYQVPVGRGRMGEAELAQWFAFEPIQTAVDFRIDVTNIGRGPARFLAHWKCERISVAQHIAYRPERISIAPPTAPIGCLGEDLSGASDLHHVPGRSGRPGLETRPPPGWGWDPGDPDGEG